MTTQEMAEMEKRLAASKRAIQRVEKLLDALSRVKGDGIDRLSVPLRGDSGIEYQETPSHSGATPRWQSVCWSKTEEPGLASEIQMAVIQVLEARLDAAKAQLEAI